MPDTAITARPNEPQHPTHRADVAGTAYAARVSPAHRKSRGLYLTPTAVANFMAAQITTSADTIRILDPAAGAGILLCSAVEFLTARATAPRRIELVAYEVDGALADILADVLAMVLEWAASRGVEIAYEIVNADFLLEHAAALRSMGELLPHPRSGRAFDVVIANPPYFKLNKGDPRAVAAAAVVHGQPNIYGLFMAVGAALLAEGGESIFITPRSFASGLYFGLFRKWYFNMIRPEFAHVFGSRRDTFVRDAVLQENIVVKGIRQEAWWTRNSNQYLIISTSHGINDLHATKQRSVRLDSVLDIRSREKVLRLPITFAEDELIHLVDRWPGSLEKYGLQISTGPVVAFRADEFIETAGQVPESHVPLLWMNHVLAMRVTWPLSRRKPEYIKNVIAAQPILVPNRNYVLLRRFSAKEEARRLVAGPYIAHTTNAPMLGLENHLNYIARPGGTLTEDEAFGLAALFSSALLDTYFRSSNGNTQVGATELRKMPLPSLDVISAIGRQARAIVNDIDAIDNLVMRAANATRSTKVCASG